MAAEHNQVAAVITLKEEVGPSVFGGTAPPPLSPAPPSAAINGRFDGLFQGGKQTDNNE